eukprot:CAMPEP_0115859800 /NCGR_PEP_ID=MMETSP0287-20121206/16802_1 /TAXON_ID=412157 /ORGANISM="Chrysochromulina rotalis, Strain UIO044" /LENGTH=339 /DNA_ID=CAMNT_0003314111 /DNA_START=72 /DNA_END=1091 /DNA_ORIENTATION=-
MYPIGTPGQSWSATEKAQWRSTRALVRSYEDEVVKKLIALSVGPHHDTYELEQYGALSSDPERYPLYSMRTRQWSAEKPSVLVTGGVHGYETSGVQGAILFLQESAMDFGQSFNIIVVPCVSPWGYETIQRWNAQAIDPNRSFNPDGEVVPGRSFNPEAGTEESLALIKHLNTLGVKQWACHIDLHETTDTDETEFRPAKAARDGEVYTKGEIPDGFYLVADSTNPQTGWHAAMVEAVKKVTHIAPPDANGNIIDEPVIQDGVIGIPPPRDIGLCAGVTNALYATTTEVYPDSPKATDEQCNRAQLAAIESALNYIMRNDPDIMAKGSGEPSSLNKAEL